MLDPSRLAVLLVPLVLLSGCDKKEAAPTEAPAPLATTPPSDATSAPDLARETSSKPYALSLRDEPPAVHAPEIDADNVREAKPRYEIVVPRVTLRSWERYGNLIHEANNIVMRGRVRADGTYAAGGRDIAATWRRYAAGTAGLFVLRDSLFSQQDHPYLHEPYAPFLPPNWVTAVAAKARAGESFRLPSLPAADDDAAWEAFDTHEDLFGDLPVSESLFDAVTRHAGGRRAAYGRQTLKVLFGDARAMVDAMPHGPRAVARVGAARIAQSDRHYFGPELRRENIIPIFVENPNAKEVGEGKGLGVPGTDVSPELVEMVLREVYGRRLKDGDVAIERYDISQASERRRAIEVLELLVPSGSPEGSDAAVWVWVTGRLEPGRKLQGEGPLAYVSDFREALEAANVDTFRVRLFAKPSIELPRDEYGAALDSAVTRHREAHLYLSVKAPAAAEKFRAAVCCEE